MVIHFTSPLMTLLPSPLISPTFCFRPEFITWADTNPIIATTIGTTIAPIHSQFSFKKSIINFLYYSSKAATLFRGSLLQ